MVYLSSAVQNVFILIVNSDLWEMGYGCVVNINRLDCSVEKE